ncbi:hypothetical protein Tsubulata_030862 [Turnera subulata]|uniref:Calmodulin-binding domain-containing protein n=1 Tax=Turnera subulata TaxID=218843 RepID=A0A9Q0FSP9_9ROSI|nr:hypothetical protein Tsubulata_030862 [Turnera subulata]
MASKGTTSSSTLKRDQKKLTPSSSSRTIQRQGSSSKLTGTDSTGKEKVTSSAGKSGTSNLKPTSTVGSRTDSKNVKKPGPDDAAKAAALLRRRSFDKPPSIARAHSSVISPTPTSNHVRKTGPEDAAHKASLLRRRSFDKPPPISRVHSSLVSPDPKDRAGSRGLARSTPTTPRAASTQKSLLSNVSNHRTASSSKTVNPRPVLERSTKTLKPVYNKSQQTTAATKTLKKNANQSRSTIQKNESEPLVPTKSPLIDTGDIASEASEDLALSDVTATPDNELQALSEELNIADEDHYFDNVDVFGVKGVEDEKLKGFDDHGPTLLEGHAETLAAAAEAVALVAAENEAHKEHQAENQPVAEEGQSKVESSTSVPEEVVVAQQDAKVEADQVKEKAEAVENVGSTEVSAAEKKHEEDKEKGTEVKEELKPGEEEKAAEIVEEASPEAADKPQASGSGKKETQAYNDVIEETKNKLLNLRKNKVRALVGAFETVIDYESASKK